MSQTKVDQIDAANKLTREAMEDLRKQKNDEELRAYREKQQQAARADWDKFAERIRNSHLTNEKGKDGKSQKTKWEKAMDLADAAIRAENQTSVNDWRSNMMAILSLFTALNEAASTSSNQVAFEAVDWLKKKAGEIPDGYPIAKAIAHAVTHPDEDLWRAAKSSILHAVKGNDDIEGPLKHKVTFKDGKVNIDKLTTSDGTPVSDDANRAFKAFVQIWLGENDYVRGRGSDGRFNDKFVHRTTGKELDEKTFNDLKPGFERFLEEHGEFAYEDAERMTPTPGSR